MKASIIITNYNKSPYLEKCIRSCVNQTYKNVEIILFDDFLNRDKYHIVLNYYTIIDKTANNRMVILKKKDGVQIPEEIIKKYELIPD